ncbi:MAG: hypothetical protein M1820_009095 [Bogoriella megaspora]|nr:MAG: hypothetical protein M1820_009095 [Bogoriella megaspora]
MQPRSNTVYGDFEHEPLDTSIQQIRVISVVPKADGPLECKLKNLDLSANPCPEYRALSYTWGPPSPLQRILLNDRWFTIRQNLYDFLRTFRARLVKFSGHDQFDEEVQWIWIDQICIDQTIVTERNHQVQMMSKIYRNASYVYVWLGLSNDLVGWAMRILKSELRTYLDLGRAAARRELRRSPFMREERFRHLQRAEDGSLKDGHQTELTSQRIRASLESFFENPYWQRLWIAQEIMLARYVRIICGETLLSWDELRRFVDSAEASSAASMLSIPAQVTWLAEHALSAKKFDFSSLFRTFRHSKCEDPRDKIYALQGILEEQSNTKIDYARSVYDIFLDTV